MAPALLLMGAPAFLIGPAIDDWYTSQPIFAFHVNLLRPGMFWRPFEVLLRAAAGLDTRLHPGLFHLLAVIGHVGAASLVLAIGRRVRPGSAVPGALALLFALSPGVTAAVWSVDSAIQTCSTALGLLGLYLLLTRSRPLGVAGAFFSIWMAVWWKESGIAWFAAAPLFALACDGDGTLRWGSVRRYGWKLGIGALCAVAYFLARQLLGTTELFGAAEGRYAVHLNPLVWARNAAMLLGSALSTVDTVALFGTHQHVLAVVSGVAGLPLLTLGFARVLRSLCPRRLVPGALAVGAVLSPHLVLGHVSEMYAHPVLAAVLVFLAVSWPSKPEPARWLPVAYALALTSCLVVSGHKWVQMHRTSERAALVGVKVLALYGSAHSVPNEVCTAATAANTPHGYSVFFASFPVAANYGRSVWALTGWQHPREVRSVTEPSECPPHITDTWVVDNDGGVALLRNSRGEP